eukprot:68092-Rhodomonas_salina.1
MHTGGLRGVRLCASRSKSAPARPAACVGVRLPVSAVAKTPLPFCPDQLYSDFIRRHTISEMGSEEPRAHRSSRDEENESIGGSDDESHDRGGNDGAGDASGFSRKRSSLLTNEVHL